MVWLFLFLALSFSASIARRVCLGTRPSCPDLLVFSMDLRLIEITGRDNADPGLSLIQRDLLFLRIIIMGYTKLAVFFPRQRDSPAASYLISILGRMDVNV